MAHLGDLSNAPSASDKVNLRLAKKDDSTSRAACACHPTLGWLGSPSATCGGWAVSETNSSQVGGVKPTTTNLSRLRFDGLHTGSIVVRVHRLHDGLSDVRMACPHHFHGIGPTCPVCCFPQPERTSQTQSPCHKWQTCGCFRTGRHCIWSDPQQIAETLSDLIVMTSGKIGCQLRADGADVEVSPRCTAIEQQQPCAL